MVELDQVAIGDVQQEPMDTDYIQELELKKIQLQDPCSSGGWLTETAIDSSGCGTTTRPAGRFGNVGTAPVRRQNAVAGSGNAGGWGGRGAGGCPSIYSPYPSLVSNCNYTSPTAIYGTGVGVFLYAIGIPSGFTPPPIP